MKPGEFIRIESVFSYIKVFLIYWYSIPAQISKVGRGSLNSVSFYLRLTLLEKNIKLFTYLFDANALITWCKTKSALCCSKELSAWTAWTKAGKSSGQSLGTSYLAILPIERRKEYSVYWINWPQDVAPCKRFCKFCFLSFRPC